MNVPFSSQLGDAVSRVEPTAGVSELLFEQGGELMRTEKGTFVGAARSVNTPRRRAPRESIINYHLMNF